MSNQPQKDQPGQTRRQFINRTGKIAVGSLPVLATLNSRSVLANTQKLWSPSAACSANPSHDLVGPQMNCLSPGHWRSHLSTWPGSCPPGIRSGCISGDSLRRADKNRLNIDVNVGNPVDAPFTYNGFDPAAEVFNPLGTGLPRPILFKELKGEVECLEDLDNPLCEYSVAQLLYASNSKLKQLPGVRSRDPKRAKIAIACLFSAATASDFPYTGDQVIQLVKIMFEDDRLTSMPGCGLPDNHNRLSDYMASWYS